MTATEAFEEHFKRDSKDPSSEFEYAIWCQAWAAATAEPDMRHPKIQRLISANARHEIAMQLVEQILEEGPETETTALDMEHWSTVHDTLVEKLRAGEAATASEREDAQRYRWLRGQLLAADFMWGDPPTPVLVFKWPSDVGVGGNCDQNIDAAIRSRGAK